MLRNAVTHSRGVVSWIALGVFFLTLLVGVSLASFSTQNPQLAVAGAVLLVGYCLFEGAFLTWRDEYRRGNKSDEMIREQQDAAYSVLHSQRNALNSQLISAPHVRRAGVDATTSPAINEFAHSVDDWITKTANAIESARLDSGSFLADTGDYGSGVWQPSERIELMNAMRTRQLEKLDRHVERLRGMHDRIEENRQAFYRALYGVSA